jgi:hypothetical protein
MLTVKIRHVKAINQVVFKASINLPRHLFCPHNPQTHMLYIKQTNQLTFFTHAIQIKIKKTDFIMLYMTIGIDKRFVYKFEISVIKPC